MQIWIHDNKMKKIVALNNDIPDMLSYTNSSWHSYLDQATSTFDFTIPKFSNGELHEDLKLINDECFVSFYVNGSYQVFYIATLQEDDFNIQLTCNNTNLEYALEYANPFSSDGAQTIEWYLNNLELLSFAAVEIGLNEISDRKRTLTFDSQETKMNRLQSLMSNFDAEFEFKVELNKDGTYKRIVINIYQEADDTHHGIGSDRKDVVLYYSNGLKGVQVTSDKTQMFNAGVFTGKDGLNLADVEFSEKNSDGVEEFYSRKGSLYTYAPLSRERYPSTMQPGSADNWIRKDFQTEYENVNDLKAYALRTLKQYAYPLVTYTASVQSGFVSHYTDLKLGDTIRIIDKNFVGGLALEARVSEMIISFDNPANNSFVFTNYRKLDNKPSSALQTRIEQVIESRLSYRIELATTGGVTFKNNEGETIIKPSLYKGNLPWTKDVTWHWTLNGVVTDGMQYRIQARDIIDTAVLTVDAFVDGKKVATTEITLTNVNDGLQGPQGPQGDEGPKGDKGDTGNGIANTVVTYGLSMSDTTEPATWSSSVPTLVKGMYLWTRTVIIYTNGESTTSYQISYIAKDADATAAIDKTKQELLEKLETVRNDSLAAAEEAKQEITAVSDDLSKAKTDFQNAVSAVDTKATNLQSDLTQAKQDLASQAQRLQEQAGAQSELTNRVSSVEKTANGTKTTVSELSKTVAQNGKDITSVTNRTKTVEDDLANTKTTLTQVQTTANSASQKTATLETGLDGLSAKFTNLKIGAVNLLHNSKGPFQPKNSRIDNYTVYQNTWIDMEQGKEYTLSAKGSAPFTSNHTDKEKNEICLWLVKHDENINVDRVISNATTGTVGTKFTWNDPSGKYRLRVNTYKADNSNYAEEVQIEEGNLRSTYSQNESDLEQKVAEYKQNADQNYASLQSTVQNLDGTVQHNKTVADQTAQGFSTRIESLETYKDGESERANAYFESAKTETAKQLTAERTAIAKDYVAKSTYTSDVTGIRNDLTATTTTANTTKTNLANYQASNDKMVASLKSSLQTTDGNVSNLQTKVEAVPGQITSAVSSVESKIPTSIGGRNLWIQSKVTGGFVEETLPDNHLTGQKKCYRIPNNNEIAFNIEPDFSSRLYRKVTFSAWVKYENIVQGDNSWNKFNCFKHELVRKNSSTGATTGTSFLTLKGFTGTSDWKYITYTYDYAADKSYDQLKTIIRFNLEGVRSGTVWVTGVKIEIGSIPSDYTPAPEDTAEQISNLSSEIKQTADGITLLATKTELNSAKNELQSGINTATNKANNNAQTISTHTTQISALNTGLQAKVSQSDFNTLSGRVTTAENNITAKANELSSKITSVEGKIPTSVSHRNLAQGTSNSWSPFVNISTNSNWCCDLATIKYGDSTGISAGTTINIFVYLSADEITVSGSNARILMQGMVIDKSGTETWTNWDKYHPFYHKWSSNLASGNNYRIVKLSAKVSNDSYSNINGFKISVRIDGVQSGKFHYRALMVTTGDIFPDSWSPAPEDAISRINSVSSEFKQTTDAIKASVSSLDKSTVKSSSLTINADGIVMKAGKSTTDVANAIGSYFAVNQNAINLFSDKINVKGSMIVDGAITGDKIQANSVDVSKISGLDATYLKAKIETAMIDWLKGKTIVADNGATKIDLLSGYINFDSDTPAVRRVTPGIPTQFMKFLKSDKNSVTTIGSNRDGSESSMNDSFAGIKITSGKLIEQTEIISDQIYFLTGANNRRGWQMSTLSGDDDRQITLFPIGNPTKSKIYASDYFIKGSNGWVNLIDFINYFNTCLAHLQNYTGRYDIWNPFKL